MSLGFYFDMTRCVACGVCQIACKDRFDIQAGGPRTRRVDSFETGSYPDARMFHLSVGCNHCENPACIEACPTGAMFKAEDGTVQHSDDLCIACQYCVNVCPYGAPQLLEESNQIIKCDSCKPLRDAGMNPVCVDACTMRALDFGDMDELRAKYGDGLVNELPALGSASVTMPNILVKPREAALAEEFAGLVL